MAVLQVILLVRQHKNPDLRPELDRQTREMRQMVSDLQQSLQRFVGDELQRGREENRAVLGEINKNILEQQREFLKNETDSRDRLHRALTAQSDRINAVLAESVGKLQESNEKKLDQMRATVDEKLTSTLTQRLDVSFKTVGEQLQNVYQSLGEMKNLAVGVSDLQRVLTNVKARGTWAEVQLGTILEQTLTSDQYERNVSVRNNGERVEYAVKIPSREEDGKSVWLPIDSKFPQEDYVRLQEAAERADKEAVEKCAKALELKIKAEASKIASLYISVPQTTDFAIMFLPTEGLYAEILRRPGLAEELQNKSRVMVCGPTTITAFLNTLRMGFRTIALDKRAAEVWKVLGAAKTQYEKFAVVLDKAKRKITEAGNVLEDAEKRNGIIKKSLRSVEQLSPEEADQLLLSDTPERELRPAVLQSEAEEADLSH